MRRRILSGVFCALMLTATHAQGQAPAAQPPARMTIVAESLTLLVSENDKPRPKVKATMIESLANGEFRLSGNVVVEMNDTVFTAQRAVFRKGELRLDGNVRAEWPAPQTPTSGQPAPPPR